MQSSFVILLGLSLLLAVSSSLKLYIRIRYILILPFLSSMFSPIVVAPPEGTRKVDCFPNCYVGFY